ncbi:MAG TPA: TAXI family TRAP transporter solute-binding subunit [Geminicoccaceae bacterium]
MSRFASYLLSVGLMFGSVIRVEAAGLDQQRDLVNSGVVGMISGGVSGTYIRVAADLADALDRGYDIRVLPIVGKGSVRNIEDLLLLRGIDIAIVQSDVLDFYRRAEVLPGIEEKLRFITKLYDEEIHLLARDEIRSVDDLAGRKVNFGTAGSGTFMTAGIVFDELGIEVEVTAHPEPEALERLRRGELAALVFVGGQPLRLVAEVGPDEGLRLLPIPRQAVEGAYVRADLTHESYPALVAPGEQVPTLAVAAIMAAYNWPTQHPRYTKVQGFVDAFFDAFEKLKQPPYHPKWREVDLAAEVPGWERMAPARALLASQ